jgi:16S rRNA processing protein RimM
VKLNPSKPARTTAAPVAAVRRVCVGVVTGAHGVRGAVRIKSFTAEPSDVGCYGPVEDENGERRFRLRVIGSAKGVLIARATGVSDRNAAEALQGLRLYLPRAALPPPAEDEYYHADLIGLAVELADGTAIGHVRAVHDFGAGADTLDIERPAGHLPAMVPFTRAVVPVVDLAGGRLVINPPPGLLEPVKQEPRPQGEGDLVAGPPPAPSPQPPAPIEESREDQVQ